MRTDMNREEHLQWCKDRAMEYVKMGDFDNAVSSMLSDLGKHDETRDHPAIMLGVMLKMGGHLNTSKDVEDFILGFN
jgi:hypothetical protein